MKKVITLLCALLIITSLLAGCKNTTPSATQDSASQVTPPRNSIQSETPSAEPTSDEVVLTTDPFPASWIGVWTCTKSDGIAVKEGSTVEFFDYDNNKITVTDETGHKTNFRIYYKADTGSFQFHFYFKDKFIEGQYYANFQVVKETDAQLILSQVTYGSEIVLEKTSSG